MCVKNLNAVCFCCDAVERHDGATTTIKNIFNEIHCEVSDGNYMVEKFNIIIIFNAIGSDTNNPLNKTFNCRVTLARKKDAKAIKLIDFDYEPQDSIYLSGDSGQCKDFSSRRIYISVPPIKLPYDSVCTPDEYLVKLWVKDEDNQWHIQSMCPITISEQK